MHRKYSESQKTHRKINLIFFTKCSSSFDLSMFLFVVWACARVRACLFWQVELLCCCLLVIDRASVEQVFECACVNVCTRVRTRAYYAGLPRVCKCVRIYVFVQICFWGSSWKQIVWVVRPSDGVSLKHSPEDLMERRHFWFIVTFRMFVLTCLQVYKRGHTITHKPTQSQNRRKTK